MSDKYKEILCNLAIKILRKYNLGHSEDLRKFTHIKVNGKFYAIDYVNVEKNSYGELVKIEACNLQYRANRDSIMNN